MNINFVLLLLLIFSVPSFAEKETSLTSKFFQSKNISRSFCTAVSDGDINYVKFYVKAGGNVNTQCFSVGNSRALSVASRKGHLPILKVLIAARAELDYDNPLNGTALSIASSYGHYTAVKLLINSGIKLDSKNVDKQPLFLPISFDFRIPLNERVKVVEALIQAGADLEATNYLGETALHRAASYGFVQIVRLLVRGKSNLESRDNEGQTPLFSALMGSLLTSHRNDFKVIRLLINAGANVDAVSKNGRTPINYLDNTLHKGNSLKILDLFIKKRANLNNQGVGGDTMLMRLAKSPWLNRANILIDRALTAGANASLQNTEGKTAFHYIAASGNIQGFKLLPKVSNKLNLQDNKGETMLHSALSKVTFDFIDFVNEVEGNPQVPQPFYSFIDYVLSINELDPTLKNGDGDTAFMKIKKLEGVSDFQKASLSSLFIKHGADI